jgi:thymidylate kinase
MRVAIRHPTRTVAAAARGIVRAGARLARPAPAPGLVVAVLGVDGAGKSALVSASGGRMPIVVRVLYLGLYGGRLARSWPVPGLGFAARLASLVLARANCAYHRRLGRLVLLDRHALDLVAAGPVSGLRATLRRHLLMAVAPDADVVVVLDAPGDVIVQRKPGRSLGEVNRARARYLDLGRRLGAPVIATSGSIDDAVNDLGVIVWRHILARSTRMPAEVVRA